MRIVVLDGGTTNPGDLSWEPLEQLGQLTVYSETPSSLVLERLRSAQAAILNRVVLGREEFSQLPDLRYVGTLATGYNTIDVRAAREYGVTVCNVPRYCEAAVAQHALSLLLCLCNAPAAWCGRAAGSRLWRKAIKAWPWWSWRENAWEFWAMAAQAAGWPSWALPWGWRFFCAAEPGVPRRRGAAGWSWKPCFGKATWCLCTVR